MRALLARLFNAAVRLSRLRTEARGSVATAEAQREGERIQRGSAHEKTPHHNSDWMIIIAARYRKSATARLVSK
jgi:hypothetical protein